MWSDSLESEQLVMWAKVKIYRSYYARIEHQNLSDRAHICSVTWLFEYVHLYIYVFFVGGPRERVYIIYLLLNNIAMILAA